VKIKIDTLKSILDLHTKNSSNDEIDISMLKGVDETEPQAQFSFPGTADSNFKITVKRGTGEEHHDVEVVLTKVISF
jgi:hypothetical protein